jgi:hypothetical protein
MIALEPGHLKPGKSGSGFSPPTPAVQRGDRE